MAAEKSDTKNQYEELNRVQTQFYTSIDGFNALTDFEIKRNAFMIIQNIAKGFPALSNILLNVYSPAFKGIESPALLRALQHKFVNQYHRGGIPKFLYYKSLKEKAEKQKATDKKTTAKGEDFSPEVVGEICKIMMFDSKDYEQYKYTENVQKLGEQIIGEFVKKEKSKSKKKKR